jgi:hypothetical protein
MGRLWRGLALAMVLAAAATPGPAQEALLISNPYNFRDIRAANPLGYDAFDVQRIGLSINHSDLPTTVVATQGAAVLTIPIIPSAVIGDKYEIEVPFDPALVGPWTITATRGGMSASVQTPGLSTPVAIPFVVDLRIERPEDAPTLTWIWPDMSSALRAGAGFEVQLGTTEEDTRDEFLLIWGVRDAPIQVGAAGSPFAIRIPIEDVDPTRLYLFRVTVSLVDSGGNILARSTTFAPSLLTVP